MRQDRDPLAGSTVAASTGQVPSVRAMAINTVAGSKGQDPKDRAPLAGKVVALAGKVALVGKAIGRDGQ